jgi:nucleoid DNA-binding protein
MADRKRLSKSQFVAAVAQKADVPKKQAATVLEAVNAVIIHELGKKGPGEVTVPGLLKLKVAVKPAVPAHEGIDPFTKEKRMFKAKPARRVVKARAVKAFKDAV